MLENNCLNHLHTGEIQSHSCEWLKHTSENGGTPPTVALVQADIHFSIMDDIAGSSGIALVAISRDRSAWWTFVAADPISALVSSDQVRAGAGCHRSGGESRILKLWSCTYNRVYR